MKMTIDKAVSWLEELTFHEGEDVPIYDTDVEAINIAIKALKQESILDKIKEEIKALSPTLTEYDIEYENPVKNAIWEILAEVLFIIDKYREENER